MIVDKSVDEAFHAAQTIVGAVFAIRAAADDASYEAVDSATFIDIRSPEFSTYATRVAISTAIIIAVNEATRLP